MSKAEELIAALERRVGGTNQNYIRLGKRLIKEIIEELRKVKP